MKNLLLFTCFCLLFSACQSNMDNQEKPSPSPMTQIDSLLYQYEDFADKQCITNPAGDTLCSSAEATFINIEQGFNPAATEKIKQYLRSALGADTISIKESLAYFNDEIQEFKEDDAEYLPQDFEYDCRQGVTQNNALLFAGHVFNYTYLGGAHGVYYIEYFNFNSQTGEEIKWRDVFADTTALYEAAMQKLAFRATGDSLAQATSISEWYNFPDDKFYLSEEYTITDEGIEFLYNVYEIAPYAEGDIEIVFPFEEIEPLMRKESPVYSFFKK